MKIKGQTAEIKHDAATKQNGIVKVSINGETKDIPTKDGESVTSFLERIAAAFGL